MQTIEIISKLEAIKNTIIPEAFIDVKAKLDLDEALKEAQELLKKIWREE